MSQQETKPWVLVDNVKADTNQQDMEAISQQVSLLMKEWKSNGKIVWSGPFDHDASSVAVFEVTESETKEFFKMHDDNICFKVLSSHLCPWDTMPLLSILARHMKCDFFSFYFFEW